MSDTKAMMEMMQQMMAKIEKLEEDNSALREAVKQAPKRREPDAKFNLIPSQKRGVNSPDNFGRVKIEDTWYEVAAWNQSGKNGKPDYQNVWLTKSTDEQVSKHEKYESKRANPAQELTPHKVLEDNEMSNFLDGDDDNPFNA
jgi:hypothetical protein